MWILSTTPSKGWRPFWRPAGERTWTLSFNWETSATDEGRKCVCRPKTPAHNIHNALRVKTYADKARILSLFRDFEKPSYHVIGNHDCDMCSKEQVFSYYGVDYGTYYSFDQGGFHFVVLDPCYFQKDGQYISYENGNYFDLSYEKEPVLPYLPPEQIQWLREDLARTPYPSVLFSHQRLTRDPVAILNPEPVREVIASAPNGVVLALNGMRHGQRHPGGRRLVFKCQQHVLHVAGHRLCLSGAVL